MIPDPVKLTMNSNYYWWHLRTILLSYSFCAAVDTEQFINKSLFASQFSWLEGSGLRDHICWALSSCIAWWVFFLAAWPGGCLSSCITWWKCNMLRPHVRQRRGNSAFIRSHYSHPTVMGLNSPEAPLLSNDASTRQHSTHENWRPIAYSVLASSHCLLCPLQWLLYWVAGRLVIDIVNT